MKLLKNNFLLILLCSIFISGCASNQPKGPKVVPLNLGEAKVYKYLKTDADGNKINQNQIKSQLIKDIYGSSGFRKMYKEYSGTGKLYYVKGVEVADETTAINISYVEGDYSGHTNGYNLNKSIASFPYSLVENGDHYELNIKPANSIVTKRLDIFGFVTDAPQLLSDSAMIKDLSKIYNKINPELSYVKNVKGEINVDYKDESVFANFKRLMGDYKYSREETKKFDIEKDSVFSLAYGEKALPLKVSVFPYRNGSKVMYEFGMPYKLKSNGENSFEEKELKKLISSIEKVAKD